MAGGLGAGGAEVKLGWNLDQKESKAAQPEVCSWHLLGCGQLALACCGQLALARSGSLNSCHSYYYYCEREEARKKEVVNCIEI